MNRHDFTVINSFTQNDGTTYTVYEYETINLYFSFTVNTKTKTVVNYSFRNSDGEGYEDENIPLSNIKSIISSLDK